MTLEPKARAGKFTARMEAATNAVDGRAVIDDWEWAVGAIERSAEEWFLFAGRDSLDRRHPQRAFGSVTPEEWDQQIARVAGVDEEYGKSLADLIEQGKQMQAHWAAQRSERDVTCVACSVNYPSPFVEPPGAPITAIVDEAAEEQVNGILQRN